MAKSKKLTRTEQKKQILKNLEIRIKLIVAGVLPATSDAPLDCIRECATKYHKSLVEKYPEVLKQDFVIHEKGPPHSVVYNKKFQNLNKQNYSKSR